MRKFSNSNKPKAWLCCFFKRDTWEEEQSEPILASKRSLKNKQDLCSNSELHVAVCYQEEDNSS